MGLGQASLLVNGSVRWPEVWAGGRAVLTRRASTQAKWRPSHCGVESVKFGCDDLDRAKITTEADAKPDWRIANQTIATGN